MEPGGRSAAGGNDFEQCGHNLWHTHCWGTSTFTLKVTDSSGAPGGALSTQQSFSLTVVSVLTIPTASLPDGTVGIAYSATLPHAGGTLPLTWGIYSGSLPSGLVLQQNTGVISGTPTTQGSSSFTVQANDSSPVQQTYTSSTFTITVNPAGPLTIRTTALVNGTVNTAYQGQLGGQVRRVRPPRLDSRHWRA